MPVELHIRARAWLAPDGWLEVHLSTEDVPPSYRHPSHLPKVRLQIDGGRAHHLDPHGHMHEEPFQC